jgi:hypothetical protein
MPSSYAQFYSRSHDALIRVYDEGGNVIETHEHKGEFREWGTSTTDHPGRARQLYYESLAIQSIRACLANAGKMDVQLNANVEDQDRAEG